MEAYKCICSVKQDVRYFAFLPAVFECALFLLASVHTLDLPVGWFTHQDRRVSLNFESVLHFQQIAPVMQKHCDYILFIPYDWEYKLHNMHWVESENVYIFAGASLH